MCMYKYVAMHFNFVYNYNVPITINKIKRDKEDQESGRRESGMEEGKERGSTGDGNGGNCDMQL